MAEEPQDVASEITPEEFDGQDAKAESSPVKETKEEVKAEALAESKEPAKEAKGTEEVPAEADTEDAPDKSEGEVDKPADNEPPGDVKPPAPKSENRYRNLANENRDLKQKVEQLMSETYAPQTVQELSDMVNPETNQPYTVAEAADIVIGQQQQMRDHINRATNAQSVLGAEAYEVMQELPMFNPDREEFDQELAAIAAETLEANLIRDPNIPEIDPETGQATGRGMIIDYRQSPKQLYKTLARASGISAARGQIKGQEATERQLANVDANSSVAPPKKAEDPLAKLWEGDL